MSIYRNFPDIFASNLLFDFCFYLMKGGCRIKTGWDHDFIIHGMLDIFGYSFELRAWWTGIPSFCKIWRWAQSMRLAFVANWFDAIVLDIFIGHTTADQFRMLWTHSVYARNIQKGKCCISIYLSNKWKIKIQFIIIVWIDVWNWSFFIYPFQIINIGFSYFATLRHI